MQRVSLPDVRPQDQRYKGQTHDHVENACNWVETKEAEDARKDVAGQSYDEEHCRSSRCFEDVLAFIVSFEGFKLILQVLKVYSIPLVLANLSVVKMGLTWLQSCQEMCATSEENASTCFKGSLKTRYTNLSCTSKICCNQQIKYHIVCN